MSRAGIPDQTPIFLSAMAIALASVTGVLAGTPPALVFTDVSMAAGIEFPALNTESLAWGDYDGDGDPDLYLTSQGANRLMRNDGPTGPGGATTMVSKIWRSPMVSVRRNDTVTDHHWLTLVLEGRLSNRSAIGARIEVETDLRTVVKEVSGGAGRGSQNDLPVEFGLGAATVVHEVRIRWPGGGEESLTNVAMDQKLTVIEKTTIFVDGFESGDTSKWAP